MFERITETKSRPSWLKERFLTDAAAYSKPDEESEFGYKWEVPVTFISSVNNVQTQVWLHTDQPFIEMWVGHF